MNQYQKGYNVISDMQKTSLNTSKGNATNTSTSNGNQAFMNQLSDIMRVLAQTAL